MLQATFEVQFIPLDEGGYMVRVPDLKGCITDGQTIEEATKNADEAIRCYLKMLLDEGSPIPNAVEVSENKRHVEQMSFSVPAIA